MDDDLILDLFERRSENAISETRKKYGDMCRRVACNILSDHTEAEECENDTYFQTWSSIPPERPKVFPAFLVTVTRNNAISRYRKKRSARRGNGQAELALSELAECADMNTDIENEYDRRMISEAVKEFVTGLKKEKRIIFLQRYYYVMDIKDIAQQNDISESKVKSVLFRIRKELGKYLEKKELY